MKTKYYFIFLLLFTIVGCSKKNTCLKPWIHNFEKPPLLQKDSLFDDCSFLTSGYFTISDTIQSIKQRARIYDGKFYIKPLDIEAEEFVFLDFKNPKNYKTTIAIKSKSVTKLFECILQNSIITKEKIIVYVFRIKKLAKLSEQLGGSELDVILFATEEYGIIGSYLYDDKEKNIIISERGDILKEYINYSNYKFAKLL